MTTTIAALATATRNTTTRTTTTRTAMRFRLVLLGILAEGLEALWDFKVYLADF